MSESGIWLRTLSARLCLTLELICDPLHCSTSMAEPIQLSVKAPGDKKLSVSIAADATVLALKEAIQAALAAETPSDDCPPAQQRLIFSGRVLKDEDALTKYKLANGHTIHLVKSAPPAAQPSTSAQVPQNMGAGQQVAGNPLAPLMRGDLTGVNFNPFAGMGVNTNNPNFQQELMSNPEIQRQVTQALSDPSVLDTIIQQSPELRAMGPQARQIMQS